MINENNVGSINDNNNNNNIVAMVNYKQKSQTKINKIVVVPKMSKGINSLSNILFQTIFASQ